MADASMPRGVPAVAAIDQGTSSSKAVVVGADGRVLGRSSVGIGRADPAPGWVEQDANEIRESVVAALVTVLDSVDVELVGIGLSNQRESAVIWNRRTGEPLGPVLGWQDRRTADRVRPLEESGWAARIRAKTGLPLDPMFSALKYEWLLDQVDPDREAARRGEIALGTIDSWLTWTLTGEHRIEIGNASRTQLLNLETLTWDSELLEVFRIPHVCLPRISASAEATAALIDIPGVPRGTSIHGILGDSHAALYAHGVRAPGQVKATYGSGSSIMGLADVSGGLPGARVLDGLVTTIAWADPLPAFAFEGTILSTGATLLWLAKILGVDPAQLSVLAQSVPDTQGVDLVPAFAGLGAPWWDESAVALVSGFGLGTGPGHLARAAFESVALQTEDLFSAVEERLGSPIDTVLADGGPSQNDWLMQVQADLSQRRVVRSNIAELSATGAAHLAGVSCGLWTADECLRLPRDRSPFDPLIERPNADARRQTWRSAIERSRFQPGIPRKQSDK
ncbi:FGGY family carbohydrate kinase [Streptosporangium sp. CA-115845]|uniref:FGGY family carbohydrate kinase n=1 Tax=Streptosporangium sp. CA-115845 TaxID=3240071 RepID=UPI003D92BD08